MGISFSISYMPMYVFAWKEKYAKKNQKQKDQKCF